MISILHSNVERHFQELLGVSFEALLAPISDAAPCGRAARACAGYAALCEARRQDDPSLPLGAWERELKRADWSEVSRLIILILRHESKDMQLLAWLHEAQIKQYGVAGISATLVLIRAMCTRYWNDIHPSAVDGDVEHRANIISSIGEKCLPSIRLAPLIGIERTQPYCWADWERALRNEQIKSGKANAELEGISLQELQIAIGSGATDGFIKLQTNLLASLQAISELGLALDPLFREQAPSLSNMSQLLQQMLSLVEGELYKRGVRPQQNAATEEAASPVQASTGGTDEVREPYAANSGNSAIRDRADAYARLAETAEFLMRLEPHSPVPYLVRRATEWGNLNTVELYQELFLRLGGQLNIFEVLGLESTEKAKS
jgi:type VI secretion system protein ImpA